MKKPKLTLGRAKAIIMRQQADAIKSVLDVRKAVKYKVEAFEERDLLVAALSQSYPSHRMTHHDVNKPVQTQSWRTVICVHTPVGQLAWTIPDERMADFAHLEDSANDWDGATKAERLARLRKLIHARGPGL